ncbi:hypothetical protein ACFMPD_02700 [Sedimentitalea sp. HM32M-2]|uniref:hypothetical protein n=1 Tax=Sedimentitalea sp. HM32M-2 TaxID=3351566 RepID=UPI00362A5BE9
MADQSGVPLIRRIIVALPYVLTVFGGLVGIAWVNMTPNASPILGIAGGAIAGRLIAVVLVRGLESMTRS